MCKRTVPKGDKWKPWRLFNTHVKHMLTFLIAKTFSKITSCRFHIQNWSSSRSLWSAWPPHSVHQHCWINPTDSVLFTFTIASPELVGVIRRVHVWWNHENASSASSWIGAIGIGPDGIDLSRRARSGQEDATIRGGRHTRRLHLGPTRPLSHVHRSSAPWFQVVVMKQVVLLLLFFFYFSNVSIFFFAFLQVIGLADGRCFCQVSDRSPPPGADTELVLNVFILSETPSGLVNIRSKYQRMKPHEEEKLRLASIAQQPASPL